MNSPKDQTPSAGPEKAADPKTPKEPRDDRVGGPPDATHSDATGSATSELLKRLSHHSLKGSRYTRKGEIARGGMGAILEVWDEDLRRTLAMKVILGESDSTNADGTSRVDTRMLGRFLEEAQITGQLDHPGITPVHELGLDSDGRVYFTMKLVQGRDLKHVFDLVFESKEGWNETRALSVMLKVCEALAYAHSKGVIHRDLKPANVMVGNFGEVYVMDWGLARVLDRKDSHDLRIRPNETGALTSVKTERRREREETPDSPLVTMDGDVMGTPAYMSPEQARGEIENLSARSDVYALGAMLYHLLARRMPYVPPGAKVNNHMVLLWVLEGPPKPLHELRADVPAELVAICEKAMSRDAAQRYPDTLALADDLRAYLEHRVVAAYETGAVAELKKWIVRNRPLALASAAAVLLLIGGLVVSSTLYSRANENAKRADAKSHEAETNARTARAEQERASASEARAVLQERAATQRANDVLSLSAIQELKELIARADALWPAIPEKIADYERWLLEAQILTEGRAADPTRGIAAHPGLKDHEAKLAEIRLRARPLTDEQLARDRSVNPTFAKLEVARAKSTWMHRMSGREPWPSEAPIAATLARESLPTDAPTLNDLAWQLADTDPAKIVFGREIEALLLARRAVSAAKESERAGIRDTLAWALFRCGRFDEALAEGERAVAEAEGPMKAQLEPSLKNLRAQCAAWTEEAGRAQRAQEEAQLAARVTELERSLDASRTFEFDDAQDRWWHAQLAELVADLRAFQDENSGGLFTSGVSEQYGWGIPKRAAFARTIEERTVSGAEARQRWSEAIAAIAISPKYAGLRLTPQLGLLPIGADPTSGLFEFWHVQSGDEPRRRADGRLELTENMGLVLVLIPAGEFTLGAQDKNAKGPNFDAKAVEDQTPYNVKLDAYFLSKYEMTQGQWLAFTGRNPSQYKEANYSSGWNRDGKSWNLLHPVEQVSWTQSQANLERMGLVLPTEAQWEHGCRGDSATAYWSGDEESTLATVGNVADAFAKEHGGSNWSTVFESWDDGNSTHTEVGSYRANGLGLHDTHGNVWEWCKDNYGTTRQFHAGDGERQVLGATNRVFRGGAFNSSAAISRSAYRYYFPPDSRVDCLGVRPARAIAP